jgi:hypothetical protein
VGVDVGVAEGADVDGAEVDVVEVGEGAEAGSEVVHDVSTAAESATATSRRAYLTCPPYVEG